MNLLKDFFMISTWQVWVLLITVMISFIIMKVVISKYKLAFHWRVLIGLSIGLTIGIVTQAIMGFPHFKNGHLSDTNFGVYQFTNWMSLVGNIFIYGITSMVVPLVFLAILRLFTKKGRTSLGWVTGKGIFILLTNVAVAFAVTFWIGYLLKIGKGFDLTADDGTSVTSSSVSKSLPGLFISYIPRSVFGTLVSGSLITVIVLAVIVGIAVRRLSGSPKTASMFKGTEAFYEKFWKLINSILIFFIKIMPYAIVAMMSKAIIAREIAQFKTIGMILVVGYIGIILMFIYHTLTMFGAGIKVHKFWAKSWKPILTGFSTQSSMGTLPVALETMKNDLGFKGQTQEAVMPLSTTIGLTGCAGVQSGTLLSMFWWVNKFNHDGTNFWISGGLAAYFFIGLVVTVIISIGIAGVPGTAGIVTKGVMLSLGYGAFAYPLMGIISSLNGIFDMGRTAVNVNGGLQASAIVAKGEGELPDELVWRKNKLFDFKKLIKWDMLKPKITKSINEPEDTGSTNK